MSAISEGDLNDLIAGEMPWATDMGLRVEDLGEGTCRVRLPFDPRFVRPGGTLAGPMMLAAASLAMYAAVLSLYGRVEAAAARSLTCTYLRAGPPADLLAEARVLHRAGRSAYGVVALYSADDEAGGPVAHITMTFTVPAAR